MSSALGTTLESLIGWDERYNPKGSLSDEAQLFQHLQTKYGNTGVSLLTAFVQLNRDGQQKAVQQLQDLLDVPKHRKENEK